MADENKKPETMMEALEGSIARTERTLVDSFRDVRAMHPELSIGVTLRMFHFSTLRAFKVSADADCFGVTLGLIAKYLLPHLTDEEKEALRNDKLSGLL